MNVPRLNKEAWWKNLDRIIIVAVPSLADLPDHERDTARRRIEKIRLPKLLRRKLLDAEGIKNPKTSMRPFLPNASELSVARQQDEMLKELGVRSPAVWAAYYGAPANGDRIWAVGVPRAEGGLTALYSHIRTETEFRMSAARDANIALAQTRSEGPLQATHRRKRGPRRNGLGPRKKPVTRGRKHEINVTPHVAARRAIVNNKRNVGLAAVGLCRLFDQERIPLPRKMAEAQTWDRAYRSSAYRHSIDSLVSRDRHSGN